MPDVIIARTLERAVGLREGGIVSEREVLATYRSEFDGDVFALCRNGLLLRQADEWRYIDNGDVEKVDLPIMEVKTSREGRRVILVLKAGERVNLSVDGGDDGNLDVFPIHAFLRRRVHQHKVFGRQS